MSLADGASVAVRASRVQVVHVSTAVDSVERSADRRRLVEIVRSTVGPRDPRVLEALGRVPRHAFVPEALGFRAYEDSALPIGEGQTISQPSMIAIMLDALRCAPGSHVLEIGAGSGYAAALLAELAGEVDAVEIRPDLAARARETLARLGVTNVRVHVGDGSHGLPHAAPFDRILVSAAPARVPPELVRELAPEGRIACPVGDDFAQVLIVGVKDADGRMQWERDIPCMFVPLVGAEA